MATGINSITINQGNEMENSVNWMWNSANKDHPTLLQVMIDLYKNIYPLIALGKPINGDETFC